VPLQSIINKYNFEIDIEINLINSDFMNCMNEERFMFFYLS